MTSATPAEQQDRPRSVPLGSGNPAVTGLLGNGGCRVVAIAARETSGVNVASFDLVDGHDGNGQRAVPYQLNASETVRDYFGEDGLYFGSGVWLQVNTGTLWVTVWVVDA